MKHTAGSDGIAFIDETGFWVGMSRESSKGIKAESLSTAKVLQRQETDYDWRN
jgi:hypothetical protein